MLKRNFLTEGNINSVCKDIESIIRDVLGTLPNSVKENNGKLVTFYPARRFLGTDDLMDDVQIIVRKVNNSTVSIKLINTQRAEEPFCGLTNWRVPMIRKAYNTLERVLEQIYRKEIKNNDQSNC